MNLTQGEDLSHACGQGRGGGTLLVEGADEVGEGNTKNVGGWRRRGGREL